MVVYVFWGYSKRAGFRKSSVAGCFMSVQGPVGDVFDSTLKSCKKMMAALGLLALSDTNHDRLVTVLCKSNLNTNAHMLSRVLHGVAPLRMGIHRHSGDGHLR